MVRLVPRVLAEAEESWWEVLRLDGRRSLWDLSRPKGRVDRVCLGLNLNLKTAEGRLLLPSRGKELGPWWISISNLDR
jgi:hypothetical protein